MDVIKFNIIIESITDDLRIASEDYMGTIEEMSAVKNMFLEKISQNLPIDIVDNNGIYCIIPNKLLENCIIKVVQIDPE